MAATMLEEAAEERIRRSCCPTRATVIGVNDDKQLQHHRDFRKKTAEGR